MYSVMRRTGDDLSIVQSGIATLETARRVASRFRQQEADHQVRYYVISPPNQARKTTKGGGKGISVTPRPPTTLNAAAPIRQCKRHTGGAYRVIRVQGDWQQFVKGSFQTEDEACKYALELQKQAIDPSITYWVEYTSTNPSNKHKPDKPKLQRPSNQESKAHRRRSREQANDYRRDDWYRDDELLGLGIPAQTGHGRRSRRWFNDL